MADASLIRPSDAPKVTAAAAVGSGEVQQGPDGRSGFYNSTTGADIGTAITLTSSGVVTLPKATTFALLKGGRVFWDHSANQVHFKKVNDRDYYLGRATADAAQSDSNCSVTLNVDPRYDIDLVRDGYLSVPVGTSAVGGFGYPVNLGGTLQLEITATNEAQKVDALSVDGFSKDANAIIEAVFRVQNDGASTAVDASIGIANATHATDADAITEHLLVHLDENVTNINLQSKDGSTTVAATNTTKTYTEGSAVANRVEVWIDMRDPADVQVYVDGVNVLPATVFNVNAAVGPFFLLVHVEKTATTDVYKLLVDRLTARFAEQ